MFCRMFFLLSVALSTWAQPKGSKDYLVLTTGDTLYGTLVLKKNQELTSKLDKKIKIKDEKGKIRKYNTNGITTFRFDEKVYEPFWLRVWYEGTFSLNSRYDMDTKKGTVYFLKVITKGPVSHYQLEWQDQGESLVHTMDLLKKEEDTYFVRVTQGLFGLKRKVLYEYFHTCPLLAEQIEQKELKDLEQIVRYYNNNCQRN